VGAPGEAQERPEKHCIVNPYPSLASAVLDFNELAGLEELEGECGVVWSCYC